MRIAFIVNQFPALSQTFILNQITGLIDRGHQVDIYANRPSKQIKTHPEVERYQLLDRTYYFSYMPQNALFRIVKALGLIMRYLYLNPQLILRSLNLNKQIKNAAILEPLYWSIPFLKHKQEYDIVQCHFGPAGIRGAALRTLGALRGLLITTFHGYDVFRLPQTTDKQIYDSLFASGDAFFAISQYIKSRLIELGCVSDKVFIHKVGVELNKFTLTLRQLRENEPIQVVTLARLIEKKGLEYAIRAIAELVNSGIRLEYKIIGGGPLEEELKELIQQLNVSKTVSLLGWKNQTEIIEILKEAHIFLAPSVTSKDGDQEGIPTVLMEAMAVGLPIISTYHSGIPELVQDGVSGFLVSERDVDALAEKLSQLISNPELWLEIGRAGRAFVEANHDIDRLNDQLVQTYQDLLSKQKG